jgi:ArsR family transcriptional regulator
MTQMSKRRDSTSRKSARCACLAELLDDRLFKALGDPRRIAILARVAESPQPCTVSAAASCCPTDISVVSRHLAILRDAGILGAEKRGREVYYSVRCPELVAALRALADGIEQCCAPKQRKVKEDKT